MPGILSGRTFDDASAPPAGYLFRTTGGTRTIWEFGDSLTAGTKYDNTNIGGYRKPFYDWAITTHAYLVTFEGLNTAPALWTNSNHSGMSGYTLAQLKTYLFAEYATTNIPAADGVIFMGGTNDVVSGAYDGASSIATYRQILQHIQSHYPPGEKTWIFVTTIGDSSDPVVQARVDDFNGRLTAEWNYLDAHRPAGARLLIRMDAFTALGGRFSAPNYDVASGNIHWTDSGYAAFAAMIEAAAVSNGLIAP